VGEITFLVETVLIHHSKAITANCLPCTRPLMKIGLCREWLLKLFSATSQNKKKLTSSDM